MTKLTVIVPPDGEPVSLASAKAFLRIGHDGEDGVVSALIAQARARLEQAAGLALVGRTFRCTWTCWPPELAGRGVRLGVSPLISLSQVATKEASGALIDHTGRFRLEAGRLCLRPWSMMPAVPLGGEVWIDFTAGYGTATSVPEDLREAVLRLIAELYAQRAPAGFEIETSDGPLPKEIVAILNARREVRL